MSMLKRLSNWRKDLFSSLPSRTLQTKYFPLCGAISHTLFTVHIFNPQLIAKAFPLHDLVVSNTLLFTSHVGIGFYVYNRPHLLQLPSWTRVEYSVFASLIFNFGSLLLGVLIKALFPQGTNAVLKTLCAIALSCFVLSRGHKYVRHIDSRMRPAVDKTS